MALRVWLPLNDGTLKNIGISNIKVTNNGATVNDSGKIGKCFNFDGNDYIGGTYTLSNTMTFAAWVYFNLSVPAGKHVFDARTSSGTGYQPIYIANSRIQIGGSGSSYTYFDYVWQPNTWYHICVTHDATEGKCYVNGELIGTAAASKGFNLANSACNFTLGSRCNQSNYSNVKLNDIRIYDHCLSPKEVKEISQGLVVHYKLDDISRGIIDCSGYGNDGEIYGTLSTSTQETRYGKGCFFDNGTANAGSKYILTPAGTFNWYDFSQGTLTGWICPTVSETGYGGSIGIGHDGTATSKHWAISNYTNRLTGHTANGNYVNNTSTGTLPLNEWHFIAGTLDGTTEKLYCDGELVGTFTIVWPGSPAARSDYRFEVGVDMPGTNETFTGYYSDVRFYVTPLSEDDIKDLYHTSMNIDNLGNAHGFEFIEDEDTISIKQNGLINCDEINEYDFSANAQFMKDDVNIRARHFIEK